MNFPAGSLNYATKDDELRLIFCFSAIFQRNLTVMESDSPVQTNIGGGRSQSFSSQKSDDSHTAAEYVPKPHMIEYEC
jgi:hypothetical protein